MRMLRPPRLGVQLAAVAAPCHSHACLERWRTPSNCRPRAALCANHALQEMAPRYGSLVDIYGHFLAGERSWLTAIIEPSLEGASEVRAEGKTHIMCLRQAAYDVSGCNGRFAFPSQQLLYSACTCAACF